jgi:MoxR-like ATPase
LVYVYTPEIVLAVNVALATGRPLLIRGPSGSGKSSLARNVALCMNWQYYEEVITSRTQARDLQWRFDTLRRLNDATINQLKEPAFYVEPGILWWAFDPTSAKRRGQSAAAAAQELSEPGDGTGNSRSGVVVLLDEIDKADPDVPNNLLVALGSLQFTIDEISVAVKKTRPLLLIITSNDERVLPNAFLRRCVIMVLPPPDEDRLVDIAKAHFGTRRTRLYRSIAERVIELTKAAGAVAAPGQSTLSAAEYLDTVRACVELNVEPDSDKSGWEAISTATLVKPRDPLGI